MVQETAVPAASGKNGATDFIRVYYDLTSNTQLNDERQLAKLPSNEFEINKKSTFQSLLYDTAKFWKISRGAVESKSVVLINKEGKKWNLQGNVTYLLRAKLTDGMRGVILRYQPVSEKDKTAANKGTKMFDFHRLSDVRTFAKRTTETKNDKSDRSSSMRTSGTASTTEVNLQPNYIEELWQIFAYYCVTGDPKELRLKLRSFVQFGHHCRLYRDGFNPEIMAVIYDENKTISYSSMSFDQFLDALVDIACHYLYPAVEGIYANTSGDAIAFGNLLLNDVLPNARNISWGRQQVEWTSRQDHIENHEVQDLFHKLRDPLQKIFKHYALVSDSFHRGSLSSLPMNLSSFRKFSREVGFWEIGIDALDLAKVYFLSSTTTVDRDRHLLRSNRDNVHVLHYDTFLNAIGHCALIAFPRLYELPDLNDQSAENDDLGPRILKSLFQHMAWCISKMPAVRRPAGGTAFVRALTVMFKSSKNGGNIDHLHMYRKRGDKIKSRPSNIFLQHNGPSKLNTNTKISAKSSMFHSQMLVSPRPYEQSALQNTKRLHQGKKLLLGNQHRLLRIQ